MLLFLIVDLTFGCIHFPWQFDIIYCPLNSYLLDRIRGIQYNLNRMYRWKAMIEISQNNKIITRPNLSKLKFDFRRRFQIVYAWSNINSKMTSEIQEFKLNWTYDIRSHEIWKSRHKHIKKNNHTSQTSAQWSNKFTTKFRCICSFFDRVNYSSSARKLNCHDYWHYDFYYV